MDERLYIYSGECCFCLIGMETGQTDTEGYPLHTGDIVQLLRRDYIGTELETAMPNSGLTAVVCDQFTNYSNGNLELNHMPECYVMGIKSCGFDDPNWMINIVKKYRHVVNGEHWPQFGFSYNHNKSADAILKEPEND